MKKFYHWLLLCGLMLLLTLNSTLTTFAQNHPLQENKEAVQAIDGFPVILDGKKLFLVKQGVGVISAKDRADAINNRLVEVAQDNALDPKNLKIESSEQDQVTYLSLDNEVILTITPQDARAYRESQESLAREALTRVKNALEEYRIDRQPEQLLRGLISTLIATLIFLVFTLIIIKLSGRAFPILQQWLVVELPSFRIQSFELISSEKMSLFFVKFLQIGRLLILLFLFYTYITYILNLYPWTRAFGQSILGYLLKTLDWLLRGISAYLPNVIIITVIIALTSTILGWIHPFFKAIERQAIIIPGFYTDWAQPTYDLLKTLIIALAAVITFPYLPGFNSPAFQGISVFLGLLFSLGSTSAIANVVGGIILIYTRSFQVGDRIQIGDVMGDVIEKTLLVVRIKTFANKIITIPNSILLNSNVINFSVSSREFNQPLILTTTVTLGYDVPWRKIHDVLIQAALATEHIAPHPLPFVLQTSLDDFYVSYQLNVYTHHSQLMPLIYSQLHQNLQDKCNEAGIEILSPHYQAIRDGNMVTIPVDYLAKDYVPPSFKIDSQ